jgi:iron-sulfur cluster repair protein YtfE (RIC family)
MPVMAPTTTGTLREWRLIEVRGMELATALNDASILQVFGDDHERMREALECAIAACRQSAPREACAGFRRFASDLRRHIHAEEALLFPAFEMHTGLINRGPTAVMRREHREIEQMLEYTGALLNKMADLAVVEQQLRALQALLADHDRREEMVLYPACDRCFTQPERFAAVRALPSVG